MVFGNFVFMLILSWFSVILIIEYVTMHVLFEKEEGMCGSTACCACPFRKSGDDLQHMHLIHSDLFPQKVSWKCVIL